MLTNKYKFKDKQKLKLKNFSTNQVQKLILTEAWNPELWNVYPEVFLKLNNKIINKKIKIN